MRANWKDGENAEGRDSLDLLRGEFPMGREEMAGELGCSERELRTIKSKLEKFQELTSRPSNRGTVVCVINYNTYVNDQPKTDQQNAQEETSNRPVTDQQPATHEDSKDSKDSKDSEEVNPPPPEPDSPPQPCEGESISPELSGLIKRIEKGLQFSVGTPQGYQLTRLEHYRTVMTDTDIVWEITEAADWIANKNRTWNGVLSIIKKRVENPQSKPGAPAPGQAEPEEKTEDPRRASADRVKLRAKEELGVELAFYGYPKKITGIETYRPYKDQVPKLEALCQEEGLDLVISIFGDN